MNSSSIKAGKSEASSIRELSADDEARRLAFVRERALRDEVSLLNDAEKRGRMEGRMEGESRLLRKMIEIKFGAIPEWAESVLESADSQQIDLWAESILTAESLEALLGKH
ncbi:hypothetical protein CFI10_17020 [Marinobacterium iners]|uniref:hypothetical protein n=1 Tax=Marinobacterium iners TaxID=48076 RepID=UPI001AF98186|nr:hypothetical protein [Marinobacterium iners]QSR36653.1 hypothetical protein CFI10_17020 [Marinobacterium iners]